MRSNDPSGSLSASKSMIREGFAPRLHRRVLLGQRSAQRRHVIEDEIERGVEQPAGAHRWLDKPFWKLEGCERQLRDLGSRILPRPGDSPPVTAANPTGLH